MSPKTAPPLIRAEGLTLAARGTAVWRDLDFELPDGLSVVSGPSGSGRSSLLLALTGRMSGLSGALNVAGEDAIRRPGRVRAVTSVARIDTMISLEPQLTVAEAVTERALIDGVPTRRIGDRMTELEAILEQRFARDRLISRLDAFDQTLLAVGLAFLRPARLTVLDDAELGLTVDELSRLCTALLSLTRTGPAVVIATRELSTLPPGTPTVVLPDPRPESIR